jgi:hypothetical protein
MPDLSGIFVLKPRQVYPSRAVNENVTEHRDQAGDIFRNDNGLPSLWLPGFRIGNPNPSRRQSEQTGFFGAVTANSCTGNLKNSHLFTFQAKKLSGARLSLSGS